MPLQPGEVSLLTLFADVHYYFSPPNAKPAHHRFDKSSYIYLYHDAINKRGRIEVANHAGTADQDAFTGFLDASHVEYSYKHPTLFTITINSKAQMNGVSQSPQHDTSQWHLPGHDLRNEGKYMYKLHTLDIYFWTVDDATLFLDSLKRCLHPQQIRVLDTSTLHSEHRDSMSPVVQRLENAAISTPQAAQRINSVSTAQSTFALHANRTPVSPMNTPPIPAGIVEAPGNYAPIGYNPAAPSAPEPIAHREKTPPPADAAAGTGLAAAAMHDHGSGGYGAQPGVFQHQGSFQTHSQQPYMPGPPSHQSPIPPPPQQIQGTNTNSSFPPPPLQQQTPYSAASGPPASAQSQQYAQSFAPPPAQAQAQQDPNAHLYGQQQLHQGVQRQSSIPLNYQQMTPQPTSPPAHQQSFSPQPSTQYANYNAQISTLQHTPSQHSPAFQTPPPPQPSTGYQPGVGAGQPPSYTPSTPGYGQPMPSPGFAGPPHQPPVPVGGYSQYSYGQQAGAGAQQPEGYSIHQQAYRPTESEASHGHGKPGQVAQAGSGQQNATGKFEAKMDKVEKGVGRFLKRLDKKL